MTQHIFLCGKWEEGLDAIKINGFLSCFNTFTLGAFLGYRHRYPVRGQGNTMWAEQSCIEKIKFLHGFKDFLSKHSTDNIDWGNVFRQQVQTCYEIRTANRTHGTKVLPPDPEDRIVIKKERS